MGQEIVIFLLTLALILALFVFIPAALIAVIRRQKRAAIFCALAAAACFAAYLVAYVRSLPL